MAPGRNSYRVAAPLTDTRSRTLERTGRIRGGQICPSLGVNWPLSVFRILLLCVVGGTWWGLFLLARWAF